MSHHDGLGGMINDIYNALVCHKLSESASSGQPYNFPPSIVCTYVLIVIHTIEDSHFILCDHTRFRTIFGKSCGLISLGLIYAAPSWIVLYLTYTSKLLSIIWNAAWKIVMDWVGKNWYRTSINWNISMYTNCCWRNFE